MRHRLCRHRQRVVGVEIGSQATVVLEQLGREIEMLLKREFRVGLTEEGKRSQLFDLMGRRALGDGRARDGSDEEVGVRSGLSCSSFGVTVVMQICAVACAGRGVGDGARRLARTRDALGGPWDRGSVDRGSLALASGGTLSFFSLLCALLWLGIV